MSEILCFYPPEKMFPFYPTLVLYPLGSFIIVSCKLNFLVNLKTSYIWTVGCPNIKFSITVPLNKYGACETKEIYFLKSKLSFLISIPSILIYPLEGSYSLNIRFRIVLFPAPL